MAGAPRASCSRASRRAPSAPSPSCRCSAPRSGAAARRRGTTRRSPTRGARCVHELFEAQARRTPDAIAVVAGEGRAELRASSTGARTGSRTACARWASGPDVLVGLCLRAVASMLVVGAARHPQGGRRLRAARSRPTRASASRSCSRTRGAPCPRRRRTALGATLPAGRRGACGSTRTRPTSRPSRRAAPPRGARARSTSPT